MVLLIIGIVVFLLIVFVVSNYNSLVSLRNKVKDSWAQIDVVLKRRADLIPNLVETVKGYAKHENETLEAVISARNKFVTASTPEEEMASSNQLTQALTKLMALSEAYPELKANENFMALQNELGDTEDKITFSRQFYNDTVLKYNNKVEMFPSNIIASIFGFKKSNFFEISETEKSVPKVQF